MGRGNDDAICFVVHSAENGVMSFCYRVWAAGTSFYIKLRNINTSVKISVHGPDPRHGNRSGFKFGIDGSAAATAHEVNAWRFEPGSGMGWFPGVSLGNGVTHLARIRVPWSTLQRGAHSGPQPTTSKDIRQHFKIAGPGILRAADVDLFLSDSGKPYWPDVERVNRDNAGMGPLKNEIGQLLTAVSFRRSLWRDIYAAAEETLAEQYGGPRQRTLAVKQDESGFLWIRELVAPVAMLRRYDADELRGAAGLTLANEPASEGTQWTGRQVPES